MRQPITEALRELLARKTRDGRTLAELLAETIIRKALAGDLRFIELILDRTEGPVARRTESPVAGPGRVILVRPSDPAQAAADRIPCAGPLAPRRSVHRPEPPRRRRAVSAAERRRRQPRRTRPRPAACAAREGVPIAVRLAKARISSGCDSRPDNWSLPPVALRAAVEGTKPSKPSRPPAALGGSASRQAATTVNAVQAPKPPDAGADPVALWGRLPSREAEGITPHDATCSRGPAGVLGVGPTVVSSAAI
jgi:hypothetical protein